VATQVLAATALDMLASPDTLKTMRTELDETTGGKGYVSSIPPEVGPATLPNPYENPTWEPGPTWKSFLPEKDAPPQQP